MEGWTGKDYKQSSVDVTDTEETSGVSISLQNDHLHVMIIYFNTLFSILRSFNIYLHQLLVSLSYIPRSVACLTS